MSLAASLAGQGVRPASFLPAIKCSDCGHEIEIAAMGDHVCSARPNAEQSEGVHQGPFDQMWPMPPTYKSQQLPPTESVTDPYDHWPIPPSSPKPDRRWPEEDNPYAMPGGFQEKAEAPLLPDTTHTQSRSDDFDAKVAHTEVVSTSPPKPDFGIINPPPPRTLRNEVPPIDSVIANRPFLSALQEEPRSLSSPVIPTRSESRNAPRSLSSRSATNRPRLYDHNPPSPELSVNMDCAFPPFPVIKPVRSATVSRPKTPNQRPPTRQNSGHTEKSTDSLDSEPKSPHYMSGENMLRRMITMKRAPFGAATRRPSASTTLSKDSDDIVSARKTSDASTLRSSPSLTRPSTMNRKGDVSESERIPESTSASGPLGEKSGMSYAPDGDKQGSMSSNTSAGITSGVTRGTHHGQDDLPDAAASDKASAPGPSDRRTSEPRSEAEEYRQNEQSSETTSTGKDAIARSTTPSAPILGFDFSESPDASTKQSITHSDIFHATSHSGSSTSSRRYGSHYGSDEQMSPITSNASSVDTFSPPIYNAHGHGDRHELSLARGDSQTDDSQTSTQISFARPGKLRQSVDGNIESGDETPRKYSGMRRPSHDMPRPHDESSVVGEQPHGIAKGRPQSPTTVSTNLAATSRSDENPFRYDPSPNPSSTDGGFAFPTRGSSLRDPAKLHTETGPGSTTHLTPLARENETEAHSYDAQVPPTPRGAVSQGFPVPRRLGAMRPMCRGCNMQIEGKSVKAADGRLTGRWHKVCFTCKTCNQPFTTADFYVLNNEPYCEQHYHENNGSLCRGCHRGIEGPYLEATLMTRYGSQDHKYHPRCFTCVECRQVLADDYFEIRGRVYCERHAQANVRAQARSGGGDSGGLFPHDRKGMYAERRTTRLMMMGPMV